MDSEVRDAAVQDTGAIRAVARTTWTDTYRGVIPADVQEGFIERAYSDESLERRMSSGVLLVAVLNDEVVGFVNFAPASEDGASELAAIYVLPEAQGRGLGTRLLHSGLKRMPGVSRVGLFVERDNPTGRRFYESKGFVEVGSRTEHLFGHDFDTIEMVRET